MKNVLASKARENKFSAAVLAVASFAIAAVTSYSVIESTNVLTASTGTQNSYTVTVQPSNQLNVNAVRRSSIVALAEPVSGTAQGRMHRSAEEEKASLVSLTIDGPANYIKNWRPTTLTVTGTYSDGTSKKVPATWQVLTGTARLQHCTNSSVCTVASTKSRYVEVKAKYEDKYAMYTLRSNYTLHTELLDTPTYNDEVPDWAKENIETVGRLGIMKGYEDKTFKPGDQVTFAQMATMLHRTINTASYGGVDSTCPNAGSSIPKDHFAYEAFCYFISRGADVSWATKLDEPMKRGDIITMLNDTIGEEYFWEYQTQYWDTSKLSLDSWKRANVVLDLPSDGSLDRPYVFAIVAGIFEIREKQIRPNDYLNRAEAATVALRTFEYMISQLQD